MPTLPQGRLWVLISSLILSCTVFGISISLLRSPRTETYHESNFEKDWRQTSHLWPRDPGPGPPPFNVVGFRNVMILGTASSALNMVVSTAFLVATFIKRQTIISAVAVEAPCIYIASFMWLTTGAYAEHNIETGPYFPYLDVPECLRYKVLEGIAFVNWIQLMLYANTLMTVATICHVRKRSMWLRPTSELPRFAAPALNFAPKSDTVFDESYVNKTNESEVPILGVSARSVDSHNPSHFRSRLAFLPHQTSRTGIPPADPSPPHPSDSVTSLAPSVSSQPEVTPSQNGPSHSRPSTGYRLVPIGEPPTYSGPGSDYELGAA